MRFKIDESLSFSLKRIIEESGPHEVDSVFHEGLVGTDDRDLIKHCLKERRILITLDNDFIQSYIPKNQKIFGVLLLKPILSHILTWKYLYSHVEIFPWYSPRKS